jgi:hypothetical protein
MYLWGYTREQKDLFVCCVWCETLRTFARAFEARPAPGWQIARLQIARLSLLMSQRLISTSRSHRRADFCNVCRLWSVKRGPSCRQLSIRGHSLSLVTGHCDSWVLGQELVSSLKPLGEGLFPSHGRCTDHHDNVIDNLDTLIEKFSQGWSTHKRTSTRVSTLTSAPW